MVLVMQIFTQLTTAGNPLFTNICSLPNVHFVYVIGLHAVQFGNNWMRKILRPSPILLSENFLNPIISKLDKHVVLLLINYTVTKIEIILLRGAALTTDHSLKIFNHVFVLSFNGFLFTFLLFCHLSSSS